MLGPPRGCSEELTNSSELSRSVLCPFSYSIKATCLHLLLLVPSAERLTGQYLYHALLSLLSLHMPATSPWQALSLCSSSDLLCLA